MSSKIILLVEDNPDDEALTLRAFQKCNILNKVVVARDAASRRWTTSLGRARTPAGTSVTYPP